MNNIFIRHKKSLHIPNRSYVKAALPAIVGVVCSLLSIYRNLVYSRKLITVKTLLTMYTELLIRRPFYSLVR